jgi:acyl-coenzyme A thioesterase PaaI-like protein
LTHGTDEVDETTRRKRELAAQLRRINERLVLVRPPADAIGAAIERARAFADLLDGLPERDAELQEVSEAGLLPRNFVEHSPVSGQSNAIAPPLSMWLADVDDGRQGIEGEVTFGGAYEGPPGHVHGGYIAAMFDEVLGFAQLAPGYTATLTITYRRRTPLHTRLHLEAAVVSTEGRKRIVRGTCHSDGVLLSEAEGLFIAPREDDDPLHRLAEDAERRRSS